MNKRMHKIVNILSRKNVSTPGLAKLLGVCEKTARRDLIVLRKNGYKIKYDEHKKVLCYDKRSGNLTNYVDNVWIVTNNNGDVIEIFGHKPNRSEIDILKNMSEIIACFDTDGTRRPRKIKSGIVITKYKVRG